MRNRSVARTAWTLCVMVGLAAVGKVILNLTMYDAVFDLAESVIGFLTTIVLAFTGALIV